MGILLPDQPVLGPIFAHEAALALHDDPVQEDPIGGVFVDLFGLLPPDRYGLVSDIDTGRFQFRRNLLLKATSVAVNEAPSANAPSANAQGGRRTRASR